MNKQRTLYASIFFGLLVAEVCIGLFVNDAFVRPYVGDILVTLLLCCLCRAVFPQKIRLLSLYVFLFAVCVEVSQYFDLVAILGFADNRFLSVLMGRSFSWIDILCYAVGCVAAFLLDRYISKRIQ